MTIEPVQRALDAIGAPYALIGAQAMAARGYPRFSVDVDLLTTTSRALDADVWVDVTSAGARVDCRRGDEDDPLAGVVHVLMPDGTDIDLVVGRWRWEADVIARAETMTVAPGVTMPVPQTSDLILLKLAAGGVLDIHDAAVLLAGDRERLTREVEARLHEVRPDSGEAWQQVLAARL